MTPAVAALIRIVEEAETSYISQEAGSVARAACEAGMFPESRETGGGEAFTAFYERIAATLGTAEGAYALNRRIYEERRVCPMLSPLYLVWVTALDALRAEEDAARARIAPRSFDVDPGEWRWNGTRLLSEMADGVTYEEVFALDALSVGETLTLGGGAVPASRIRRVK